MPEIKKYLSKDGLEDYNELLPHSATQMQEYVSDWLDAHPEATTTVEDNSITTVKLRDECVTTPKIADHSVTANKVSDELYQLIVGNVLRGNEGGDIVSVNDAFPAFPFDVSVDGKSTQNGTPTPNVPIQIVSVDELSLVFAGKNLFDAASQFSRNTNATSTISENTVTVTSTTASGFSYSTFVINDVPTDVDMTISFTVNQPTVRCIVEYRDENNTRISYSNVESSPSTLHIPNGTAFVNILFNSRTTNAGNVGDTCTYSNIQIESGNTATAYAPYVTSSNVPIDLQDYVLRSLPDGTKDTLTLSYLRPSTREGWAWYSRELVQAVGHVAINGTEYWRSSSYTTSNMLVAYLSGLYFDNVFVDRPAYYSPTYMAQKVMCDRFSPYIPVAGTMQTTQGIAAYVTEADLGQCFVSMSAATVSDVDAFKTWAAANPFVIDYPIATPVTHDLGEVELSVLPAPNCTIWADPTTGVMLSYERNLTIAINAIEQAIADQ